MFRPPIYKLPIQAYYQTIYVQNMNISQNKCKHKDNTTLCYQRGNQSPRRKTSLPPSKRPIIHKRMKLGYMNSRRPSKPNLPSVPKPFKLLAPTRLRRTFVFFSLPNSAITHSIKQYQLVPC